MGVRCGADSGRSRTPPSGTASRLLPVDERERVPPVVEPLRYGVGEGAAVTEGVAEGLAEGEISL
jgi:hypothetical protein